MTIKQTIQEAIKGGYYILGMSEDGKNWSANLNDLCLDPKFWQALGRALNWDAGRKISYIVPAKKMSAIRGKYGTRRMTTYHVKEFRMTRTTRVRPDQWKKKMHWFTDMVIMGKNFTQIFKLLK